MSVNSAFFNQLKSALVPLLKNVIARIPTKVSDLTNDSGYIAASAVSQATKATTTAGTAGTPTILVSEETTGANGTEYTLKRYTGDVLKSKLGISSGGGGGGTDHDFIVTAELDPETFEISSVSHALAEICAAKDAGKDVRMNAIAEVEGVIKIVFSAPLVYAQTLTSDGTAFHVALFTAVVVEDTSETHIAVSAVSGDNNGEFSITVKDVPDPISVNVVFNDLGVVTNVISDGFIAPFTSMVQTGYQQRAHVSLNRYGSNEMLYARLVSIDTANSITVFEAETEGIRYTLRFQVYADSASVPQGAYTYQDHDDEGNAVYIGVTLERELTGVENIRVDYEILDSTTLAGQITNSIMPSQYLDKSVLAWQSGQIGNLQMIVTMIINNVAAGKLALPSVTFGQADNAVYFRGELPEGSYYTAVAIEGVAQIVTSEPSSGYYIDNNDGTYTRIALDFYQKPQ